MILELLTEVNTLLYAFLVSMAPIGEVRAGIPIAMAGGYGFLVSIIVCALGNLTVIPWAYYFLDAVHHRLIRWGYYTRIFDSTVVRVRKRAQKYIDRYGDFGVILFVAIPLPGSGAWTGVLAAWLFGIKPRKAIPGIALGTIIASIIVALITSGIFAGGRFLF